MRLHRLRRMGLAELAGRSKQEALKWLDRVGGIDELRAPAVREVDGLRANGPGCFFRGVSDPVPELVINGWCTARDRIVAAADRLCEGRFDLLGHRGLTFGDPIDWHLDPIAGRRPPLIHWSRLDPLDASVVGDSKIIWELNRHQWLVHLAEAYHLTGDERYAAVAARHLGAWMRANPRGRGINWASSLEVALRLISWCWTLCWIRRSEALAGELFADMLRGMATHAAHVEQHLSYYFSPNTHLTGEALGLFYAGVVLRELDEGARWRTLGAGILVEQIGRQVHADGVYFEQSTYYQRYTVEIYLHFLILAARNDVAVPPAVTERVQQLLDFLVATQYPNGSMPQIGDADGGWILPLERRGPDDLRGIFSTAAALFQRADYAWAARGPTLETFWLLGEDGLRTLDGLTPVPPATASSRLFADGGYAVMRSGWEADAHHLIFDVGPLGCPHSGGHGHADLLSVQCSAFGEPYIVDAGTCCYAGEPAWRNFFRSTAAHNTVLVDGIGQAAPAGPFVWKDRPRARLGRWASTEAFDLADADHDAYRVLADPVVHRRRVIFVKPRYWILVDDLDGTSEHRVELRFQFAPKHVTVEPTLWARVRGPGGRGLLIRAFAMVPLKGEVYEGEIASGLGWVSADYGQRQPAPGLIYSATTTLPLRIVTLLYPTENWLAPTPPVSSVVGNGRNPVALVFGDQHEMISFGEDHIAIAHSSLVG